MTDRFGKVAVLMGGPSAEREISLISGKAVLGALLEKGVDAHAFDPKERELFDLKREGYARAFIALHGRFGEDGTVQGALEVMGLPYTGSGVMASALSMDKWRTKLVWLAAGIPTPRYAMVDAGTDWARLAVELGLPVVVKPAHEGSTLGLTIVRAAADLAAAYAIAARFDPLVLAEEYVEGQELTASILGDEALPLIRIVAPQGNYDYQNKYFTDDTKYHCPAGIRAGLEDEIRRAALASFRVLGCRGWGRADVMLRTDGTYSFLEMNTSPGMTGHSLVPMAAKAVGISYADLCLRILEGAALETRP
ncbi:MAG TPA: D-alanine--D-alanine ligase [Usitatibacteraceae bacterium]|nr:D-alanine--D-alanine ligase [Usitatibacteraceae bacterium]